jgi:hypothetical protein
MLYFFSFEITELYLNAITYIFVAYFALFAILIIWNLVDPGILEVTLCSYSCSCT